MLSAVCFACALALAAPDAKPEIQNFPNAEFREGDAAPSGWKLSGGQGRWVDKEILEVTGAGNDSNHWRCEYPFKPGELYRFEVRARRTAGSGGIMVGPDFANRDFQVDGDWKWYGYVFRAPDRIKGGYVRLGQWETTGTLQFDGVRLTRVLPVHKLVGDMVLGEGELIRAGQYTFSGHFGGDGTNAHRTLHSATAGFNTDRWCLGPNSQVTYRFDLPGCKFHSASASFNVSYHVRGDCVAEVSRDGKEWRPLVSQKGLGTAQAALPADLLPAETIYLRLSAGKEDYFQIDQAALNAALGDSPRDAAGKTLFAGLTTVRADLSIEQIALIDPSEAGEPRKIRAIARNRSNHAIQAALGVQRMPDTASPAILDSKPILFSPKISPENTKIAPGSTGTCAMTLPQCQAGVNEINVYLLQIADDNDKGIRFACEGTASLRIVVPDYHRADFGQRIEGIGGKTPVWWCPATHKIAPQRAVPDVEAPAAQLSAARNDREAVQIVLRPTGLLKGLTATAGPLRQTGSQPHEIPAENVRISRVYYHFVHRPTDNTGVSDWWPDALPPLAKPIDLPAGKNQPLWVLVHVPRDARPGDYTCEIKLQAEGWAATVPLNLHVWDFTLPDRNHVETGLGLEPHAIFRYHQLKTEEDKRRVLDLYLQSFAEHRISPYDPVPLDPIGVKFEPEAKPPRAVLDFSRFDPAMQRALEKFHFSNFVIHLQGMGGGTFHERYEPMIGKFKEGTPEYQAMFSSYIKQLEEHLKAKGWLDRAYTYWFDEPDPKDYAFVRAGMERIKRHAPGITTMLTEQPEDALAGPVDIWCLLTPEFRPEIAARRRAAGDRFWWYVCCGPKAPFCTLFIDHPATELRVWLWQTWQRNVSGVLVWSTNYWTSDTAFPDKPQNPYEDPMGYVSGYGVPKGTKQYWGNGDGRFLYPPEAAAVPGASGLGPVLEGPVSSIRWEMLREGIEDYEFLYLLRKRLNKHRASLKPEKVKQYEALLEVPAEITRDMTTFTTDPAPIHARRAAIAEAIERLGE